MALFSARSHRVRIFWQKALAPVTRTSFAVFTFLAGFLLTLWPVAASDRSWNGMLLLAYYFSVWGLLLLVNLVIGLRLPPSRSPRNPGEP